MPSEGKFKPSLEQERAHYAWQQVTSHGDKEYANLAKAAPSLVMGNGLMQTLAFFYSKRKQQHHLHLCEDICRWLMKRFRIQPENRGENDHGSFRATMAFLHGSEPIQYRRATDEAMELLRWIRQFASAVQRVGGG